MQDSFDAERTESKTNHEKEVKQVKAESEEELQTAKKEYNQRLEAERSQARDEVKRLKDELYDHSGKNSAREFQEQQNTRNSLNRFHDEIKSQADQRVSKAEDRTGQQAVHQQELVDSKVDNALSAQNRSHFQEMSALEDELGEYRNADRDVESDRAKAKYQSIQENEKNYLEDKRRIIDGYDRQITSMKGHEDEMAQHYDRQLMGAVFDSKKQAQDQIRNQKAEFEQIQRANVDQRNGLEKTFTTEVKNLKTRQDRASDNLIARNNTDRNLIAASKDDTYQNYIAAKDTQFVQDVKERDAKIQDLQTTSDPMKVSPFVVKKISDASEQRNFVTLTEAQNVFQKNLDATNERDVTDRRDLANQLKKEVTDMNRSTRREIDTQSRQYNNSYTDLQNMHETSMANLTEQKRGLTERMYEKHAMEIAGAQTAKQDALLEQRESLNYEKGAAIDEAEQSRRNQDREWSMKANDLRRGLETQLTEERDQHEKTTSEIRLEFDKKLRDQDRTSKRALDDRVRSYEYQIRQQELAFKEKEHFLTEHYEEELDRMKRTNAHLIQKKS